ncbi:hypothetical protein [Zavarzinia sp. CC-PAN008]
MEIETEVSSERLSGQPKEAWSRPMIEKVILADAAGNVLAGPDYASLTS